VLSGLLPSPSLYQSSKSLTTGSIGHLQSRSRFVVFLSAYGSQSMAPRILPGRWDGSQSLLRPSYKIPHARPINPSSTYSLLPPPLFLLSSRRCKPRSHAVQSAQLDMVSALSAMPCLIRRQARRPPHVLPRLRLPLRPLRTLACLLGEFPDPFQLSSIVFLYCTVGLSLTVAVCFLSEVLSAVDVLAPVAAKAPSLSRSSDAAALQRPCPQIPSSSLTPGASSPTPRSSPSISASSLSLSPRLHLRQLQPKVQGFSVIRVEHPNFYIISA
jgi:hypothetical protein